MAVRVICQQWQEIEVGWGDRPDGYSLHATLNDRSQYCNSHQASLPDRRPKTYSQPIGSWYYTEVDDEMAAQLRAACEWYGLRVHGPMPDPPEGLVGVYRQSSGK